MPLTNDETLALIQLARSVEWQYRLDQYTDESLKVLLDSVKRAEKEVFTGIADYASSLPSWVEEQSLALLDYFSDLTVGIRSVIEGGITELASEAGASAFVTHNDILSFGGRISNFNPVTVTAEELQGFLTGVPVGGRLLASWIDSSYASMAEDIRTSILTGRLQGQDYPTLARRLMEGFGFTRNIASNITRTYVQSVNSFAQESIYNRNKDIINRVRWSAILEPGYKTSGRGTCLRCAALDGQEFPLDNHPEVPLHINCRCSLQPVLAPWRSLGVDMTDIRNEYRLYIQTPDQPVGELGGRTIVESGLHEGDYESWFKQQNTTFKRNLLGTNRFDLFTSGKIRFKDFIDDAGRLKTLKELGV